VLASNLVQNLGKLDASVDPIQSLLRPERLYAGLFNGAEKRFCPSQRRYAASSTPMTASIIVIWRPTSHVKWRSCFVSTVVILRSR
jgi:hypothetical protein